MTRSNSQIKRINALLGPVDVQNLSVVQEKLKITKDVQTINTALAVLAKICEMIDDSDEGVIIHPDGKPKQKFLLVPKLLSF